MRRKTKVHVSRGLSLSVEVLTQTIGILAKKDSGKTYLGHLLAEGMIDMGGQIIAVDPVMKWWALRLAADGRSRGKDVYVFGGKHGDLPLAPESGKLLAKVLAERSASAVLDVTFLRKGQRERFLTEFAEEFLALKQQQDDPHPVHIFLEEAQKVLPQMSRGRGGGYELQMLGAWEDIVRVGRNCGIGITMISQRPQSVNKEALSQVELLFALGVNEVPARKAIEDWVQEKGANREIIDDLPGLDRGEAIVWSPSWLKFFGRVKINRKTTLDVSASPKLHGRRRRYKLSRLDVRALGKEMEQVATREKQNDPAALKKRVAELEVALKRRPALAPAKAPASAKAVASVKPKPLRVSKGTLRLLDKHTKRADRFAVRMLKLSKMLAALADRASQSQQVVVSETGNLKSELALHRGAATAALVRPQLQPRVAPRARPIDVLPSDADANGEGKPPSEYALKLLRTLASRAPMRLTKSQLAILSKCSPKSGGYFGALAELKRLGALDQQDRKFQLSEIGRSLIGNDVPMAATPEELREQWRQALPDYERKLFDVLVSIYPETLSKQELAERANKSPTSGGYFGALATLARNELLTRLDGRYRASETLFS